MFSPDFRTGGRDGFRDFLPLSVGVLPWAMVTGVAMVSVGFTPLQAMGMNLIVVSGTAQLGTLPLIASGAPTWLIVVTALVLNLRCLIFSAALAGGLREARWPIRWLCGYILSDNVFAAVVHRVQLGSNPHWRLGYYMVPSLWCWLLWQGFALIGVLAAGAIPKNWSLEFMSTIALLVLLVPMTRFRPMLVAALSSGVAAVLLHSMPLKLGMIVAIVTGIAAGFGAEHWQAQRSGACETGSDKKETKKTGVNGVSR